MNLSIPSQRSNVLAVLKLFANFFHRKVTVSIESLPSGTLSLFRKNIPFIVGFDNLSNGLIDLPRGSNFIAEKGSEIRGQIRNDTEVHRTNWQ